VRDFASLEKKGQQLTIQDYGEHNVECCSSTSINKIDSDVPMLRGSSLALQ